MQQALASILFIGVLLVSILLVCCSTATADSCEPDVLLVVLQPWLATGQGITKPLGVGNAGGGIWKPDIQMPIPEKTEAVISMQPYTMYRPQMDIHTKGATTLCSGQMNTEIRALQHK